LNAGKYLVYATILSTFVLIVWGAYLTAGDWGSACGAPSSSAISSDWPYCNGSLAFPSPYSAASYGAFVEYMHRTLSVLVSVILVVTLVAVQRMKPRPSGTYRALLLSFVLLLIQIGLGNVEVNSDLNAAVTALHLANATALFGVMVIAGVLMHLHEKGNRY
jgi:heme A synthase